jgi:hypothetical protein
MASVTNVSFYAGEDKILQVQGNPAFDLTGALLICTARRKLDQLPILFTKTNEPGGDIVVVDAVNCLFRVAIHSADTSAVVFDEVDALGNLLKTVNIFFDIQRANPGAEQVLTIGTIVLLKPVRKIPV